ncbi:TIGR00730 family Rossman fold protein [Pasteurellaceae bacterium 22721_9_1]
MHITVYCGANLGNNPIHQQKTKALGTWIAEQNHTLVYGGGKAGLMGLLADSVLEHGGKVIGIIPTFLQERELAHNGLNELVIVNSMSERKLKMIELGDAYIALAGGLGTLEEISEVISWARIGQNNNPCILFDSDGYYQPLKHFLNHMVAQGFLSQSDQNNTLFSDNLQEIEQFIAEYTPPPIRQYEI